MTNATETAMPTMRGYFEIGIEHSKTQANVGTLWRSAYQLGAAGIFTVGHRWPDKQSSDTTKAWRYIPYRQFVDLDDIFNHLPYSCQVVGIEMGGVPLETFTHPQRCIYLLGAEDHGLSKDAQSKCHHLVSLGSVRTLSFNVAVAGSLVMYSRMVALNPAT